MPNTKVSRSLFCFVILLKGYRFMMLRALKFPRDLLSRRVFLKLKLNMEVARRAPLNTKAKE